MKLNKLLEKQVKKFFPGDVFVQEKVKLFIQAVNESYNAYEKDIDLSEHAFRITEDEYRELNQQLKQEIELKGTLINKLKEAVYEIGDRSLMETDEDAEILNIANYLKKQIILQRESENKIQDQKQFYEEILNQIPADIAVFDSRHRYLFVNPLSIKDEYLRNWIVGKTDQEYCELKNISQELAERRRQQFLDAVHSRHQTEWEERLRSRDGNIEYFLRKMYPVYSHDDKLEMVIGYGINITERKNIEEQIRRSEARYRGIFDHSLALICTHDLDGNILDVNNSATETLEYSREEMLGQKLQNLIPDDRRHEFEKTYMSEIVGKGKAEGIMVALNKRGKKIYLLYQNFLVTNETDIPYVIGFSQDITARIEAEKALKKSEEKYRDIIANMNLGLLEVDVDEVIVYANNCFCEMSGYDPLELIGQTASSIFIQGDWEAERQSLMSRRAQGASDAYEIQTRNKKGEQRWWLISGAPSFDEKGRFKGSIGIHLDITLQKIMELELRKAKSAAELSAKAKEVFLANMSHEIRTPMNAILGLGRLLAKTPLSHQQRFYLDTIHNAANNLLVIINDLLDFSKIEAGKVKLEEIGFDLNATIGNALEILKHKADEKGLYISYSMAENISPVFIGDPYRISQVLMNFLSNSLKFTEKGRVGVNCRVLSETESSQKIEFKVSDTGIGMSSDFLANLFDKFSQEDESVTRKFGGTGLGMSISKQLIEMMGGEIRVESAKNVGTNIYFAIPFKKGTIEDLDNLEYNLIDTQVLKGKKILLVEDNEMNRLLATTILSQQGAEITEAGNGNIAIEAMNAQKFDLVLMDVQMPEKDGIETTRYIRLHMDPLIPIIALTANAYKQEEERCIAAGMNDFIPKPFEEIKIVQTVARWLGRSDTDVLREEKEIVEKPESGNKKYDLLKLEQLAQGNEVFVRKMVQLFIETIPDFLLQMESALRDQNGKLLSSIAHKIKPTIQTLGILAVESDLYALEAVDPDKADWNAIGLLLAHLKSEVADVIIALEAVFAENASEHQE